MKICFSFRLIRRIKSIYQNHLDGIWAEQTKHEIRPIIFGIFLYGIPFCGHYGISDFGKTIVFFWNKILEFWQIFSKIFQNFVALSHTFLNVHNLKVHQNTEKKKLESPRKFKNSQELLESFRKFRFFFLKILDILKTFGNTPYIIYV